MILFPFYFQFFRTFWRPKKYQKGLGKINALRLSAALGRNFANKVSFA